VTDLAGLGPVTRLANPAHLRSLTTAVAPPPQAGHDTHRLAEEPAIGVLWTYAEPDGTGVHRPIGGGDLDPATGRYGQGAFNADDMARAAVAFTRHWRATGDHASRDDARALLRGVAWLQTLDGPHAGNVVLWLQPDGTLNPSAEPHEHPDPSDRAPSYWLARSIWAFGEGAAAFATQDPDLAAFLAGRLDLALDAVDRAGGGLIDGSADPSAEALYGLVAARDLSPRIRAAAERFACDIAALAEGDRTTWPHGAILPRPGGQWHAWGAQMAGALALAGQHLGRADWLEVARAEAGRFTPYVLVTGGDDPRLSASLDGAAIAYGTDAMVQNLLRVADATGAPGYRELAGIAAAWYAGDNPAGVPMYDAASGRTADGVHPDGRRNDNAGAESTIHGLLSMIALDGHPDLVRRLRATAGARRRRARDGEVGWVVVAGPSGGHALLHNLSAAWATPSLPLDGAWTWTGQSYDAAGEPLRPVAVSPGHGTAPVPPDGFTVLIAEP